MVTKKKLKQIEKEIDKILEKETPETLLNWLKNKRLKHKNDRKIQQ